MEIRQFMCPDVLQDPQPQLWETPQTFEDRLRLCSFHQEATTAGNTGRQPAAAFKLPPNKVVASPTSWTCTSKSQTVSGSVVYTLFRL